MPGEYHHALDLALSTFQGAGIDITELIVTAASASGGSSFSQPARKHCDEVQALFNARRDELHPTTRQDLSKQLWKVLTTKRRQRYQADLDTLVRNGAGSSKLCHLKERESGIKRINRILGPQGNLCTDPELICEVFALFYEELYKEDSALRTCPHDSDPPADDSVTVGELSDALKKLKK